MTRHRRHVARCGEQQAAAQQQQAENTSVSRQVSPSPGPRAGSRVMQPRALAPLILHFRGRILARLRFFRLARDGWPCPSLGGALPEVPASRSGAQLDAVPEVSTSGLCIARGSRHWLQADGRASAEGLRHRGGGRGGGAWLWRLAPVDTATTKVMRVERGQDDIRLGKARVGTRADENTVRSRQGAAARAVRRGRRT